MLCLVFVGCGVISLVGWQLWRCGEFCCCFGCLIAVCFCVGCAVNSVDFDVSLWCGFYCLRGLCCVSWYVIAHSGCVCFGVVDCYYGCGIAGLRVLVCCWFALWLLGCGCMWLVLCCMDGLFCVVDLIAVNLLCWFAWCWLVVCFVCGCV